MVVNWHPLCHLTVLPGEARLSIFKHLEKPLKSYLPIVQCNHFTLGTDPLLNAMVKNSGNDTIYGLLHALKIHL